ncbi:MAG: hypothetical protein ACOYMV_10735, partial [Verrucomicrobiia bacterium]
MLEWLLALLCGPAMSTVEEIESAIVALPQRQQLAVRDWLDGLLEDDLKVSESFRAKVEEGLEDLEQGRTRTFFPQPICRAPIRSLRPHHRRPCRGHDGACPSTASPGGLWWHR